MLGLLQVDICNKMYPSCLHAHGCRDPLRMCLTKVYHVTHVLPYHSKTAILDLLGGHGWGVHASWVEGEGVDEARLHTGT